MIASRSAFPRPGRRQWLHAGLRRLAAALGELTHALGQQVHVERLQHVVVGAHLRETLRDVVPRQSRQDDDPRALAQVEFAETLQDRHPVQPRHGDVQHHHVGADFFDHFQRLFAVVGAADHFDVALGVEKLRQSGTKLDVVVRDQHLDQHQTLLGTKIREV